MATAREPGYRLFSWEHSYFSGKARAYLRYKAEAGALAFEDVLATPELMQGLLLPATGTSAVPQLLAPDGSWVQDTSEIIDFCERRHPAPPVIPPAASAPRQRLACFLLELLADEWMVVYAFWERWHFGRDGAEPSHAAFNEQQWGAVIAPGADGEARRRAGRQLFEAAFGIHEPEKEPRGVYAGLVALGATKRTRGGLAGQQRPHAGAARGALREARLRAGGPALARATSRCSGPLYAHLYRDAVSGFALRTRFPLVAEWVERTNHTGRPERAELRAEALLARPAAASWCARPATSDGGAWLAGRRDPAHAAARARRLLRGDVAGARDLARDAARVPRERRGMRRAASCPARPSRRRPASRRSRPATARSRTSSRSAACASAAW